METTGGVDSSKTPTERGGNAVWRGIYGVWERGRHRWCGQERNCAKLRKDENWGLAATMLDAEAGYHSRRGCLTKPGRKGRLSKQKTFIMGPHKVRKGTPLVKKKAQPLNAKRNNEGRLEGRLRTRALRGY